MDALYGEILEPFAKLPELLEAFDKHLRGHAEMLGKPGHMQTWDATQALVWASELIQHRMGNYCDEELAELLQLMTPNLKQEDLSGEAIRKRRDRFRKQYPESYSWLRERIA